jgi:hypothetical protein
MSVLERELRLLGPSLDWPEGPDLAASVRAALELPAPRLAWWRRRPVLAVALGVVLAAFAAAMAVPQARTAILRALGIGSVRVELVDELPPVQPQADLRMLGARVTLARAAAAFPYPLLVPDQRKLGPYDEVRLGVGGAAQVSFVWFDRTGRVRLLVTVLPGRFIGGRYVKLVGPGTRLEEQRVDGRRTMWITGQAHGFGLEQPTGERFEEIRLAGNTLLVDQGRTTIRIEGDLSKQRAFEVYEALVPR